MEAEKIKIKIDADDSDKAKIGRRQGRRTWDDGDLTRVGLDERMRELSQTRTAHAREDQREEAEGRSRCDKKGERWGICTACPADWPVRYAYGVLLPYALPHSADLCFMKVQYTVT